MRKYIFIAFAIHFLFYISSAHCFFRELVRENALSITMQALAVHKVQNLQEGFLAGTQIKTAQGLRPIELIKLHDIIVGIDHKGQQFQRAVQHIEKKHVEHYVRISIGDQLINAAPDQKFYCPQDSSWIAAKDLTPNHVLLMDEPAHSRLSLIEHIKECAEAYTLTVDGHNLCITPYNLLVHNANVAVRALATIALDYITLARPVSVMIGDGVSLKIFQGKAYNLNSPIEEKTSKSVSAAVIKEEQRSNLLQERNYYLSRKQELINLRDQFLQIKKDIENLALQFKSFGLSVTGRVLGCLDTQLSLISNPTSEQELRLNDRQRIELSQLREHELSYIEKQIAEIQKAIGIHFDTLLKQYCLAQEKYENVLDVFRQTIENVDGNNNSTLLACFDAVETTDYYLNYLQENIKTIKLIFNYYRTSAHAQVFQETSNIQDCLNQENLILDYEKTLFRQKAGLPEMKAEIEKELLRCGINPRIRREQIYSFLNGEKDNLQTNALTLARSKETTLHYPSAENNQKNFTCASDVKDVSKEEKQKKTLDDLIKSAKAGDTTKGKSTIYEKPGTYEDALRDFESLEPSSITDISNGKMGGLLDGRRVIVRPKSKDLRPTLEIQYPNSKKKIKIRYGNKIGK